MNKHYKKHHIYTFVLGKRSMMIIFIIVLSALLGIGCAYFMSDSHTALYTEFLKMCCSHALGSENGYESRAIMPELSADVVMRQVSPIFAPSNESVSVFSMKNADMPSVTESKEEGENEKMPPETSSGPSEKSVISDNLDISNATSYDIDPLELVAMPMTYNASGDTPKVLVMHTHGCETYTGKNGAGLGSAGTYRSTDNDNNITRIGAILTSYLKEKGINAIHDKTLCDYPSYNSAYKTALGLIGWYKNKYPSISFVFDIHRDAIAEDDGTAVKLTCEIGGKKCAQAMIVCGTDKLGLSHPYWKDNLILGLKIQKTMEEKYPGFMRPLNLREERFNMHQTKGSLIFEIGTHGNTMDEAERSVMYLAEGICEVIGSN